MHQVGFSLHDYNEMHGQQNIKQRKGVMGSTLEFLSVLYLKVFIPNSFTFVPVLKSAIKLSMYEGRVQDAPAACFTSEARHFWTLAIETDGLDKMHRSVGLHDHPVSLLPNLCVKSSVGHRMRRVKHKSRIGVSMKWIQEQELLTSQTNLPIQIKGHYLDV